MPEKLEDFHLVWEAVHQEFWPIEEKPQTKAFGKWMWEPPEGAVEGSILADENMKILVYKVRSNGDIETKWPLIRIICFILTFINPKGLPNLRAAILHLKDILLAVERRLGENPLEVLHKAVLNSIPSYWLTACINIVDLSWRKVPKRVTKGERIVAGAYLLLEHGKPSKKPAGSFMLAAPVVLAAQGPIESSRTLTIRRKLEETADIRRQQFKKLFRQHLRNTKHITE